MSSPATVKHLLKFAAMMLAAAALTHIAWSSIMAAMMFWGYPHRIFDVRRWYETKDYEALVGAFLETRQAETVFAGSSFTFGYPWQEEVIFSRLFGKGVNASVIGANLAGIDRLILCNLHRHSVQMLILEIPVINSVGGAGFIGPCTSDRVSSYFSFAFLRPIGTGWFRFLWDNEAYPKPDEAIKISPVPKGYFLGDYDRRGFEESVVKVVSHAKSVAARVFVLPSPVYLPGVAQVGENAIAVRDQLETAVSACRRVSGVTCLDPSHFYENPRYFLNMTHLNQAGHRAMGEWLQSLIIGTQRGNESR